MKDVLAEDFVAWLSSCHFISNKALAKGKGEVMKKFIRITLFRCKEIAFNGKP